MKRDRRTYLARLTPQQLAALDAQAATVQLAAIGYPFTDTPADAHTWRKAVGETVETWSAQWADAIKERCAILGTRCPWPRTVIARAIQKTLEEA